MSLIRLNRKKLMNHNFAKLVSVIVMGGVIKSLFGRPTTNVHQHFPEAPKAETETPKELS